MYNRPIYYNNRNGFIPLIIGGVIGYGIGSNNRPNYYPMYPIPVYPVYPMYPFYRRWGSKPYFHLKSPMDYFISVISTS